VATRREIWNRAFERFRAKPALGPDPGVGTGFA
jgi:hypothetical protein